MPVVQGNIIDDKAIQDAAGYECYDIVVANILAPVIIMLQGEVAQHMKHGAIFITSGIINTKEQDVYNAISANPEFEIIETTYQGEWVSITARRK
jgi:ribosomal protein L11 methyltransferase